jgi:phosphoglycerate dehydrogenase-like enzyme
MKPWRQQFSLAIAGALLLVGPTPAANDEVAAVLARHGIQEDAAPIRTNPLWRKPRKVLVLQASRNVGAWEGLRAVARDVSVISTADMRAAITSAADADIIIGANPDICDPRIINNAKQVRWMASLSAGVENCMQLPLIKERGVIVTNMRGVDSPVIAEHAIALMLALARGLDHFMVDTTQGVMSRSNISRLRLQFLGGKTMLVSGLGGIGTEVARRAHGLGMKVVATRVGGTGKPDFVSHVGQPGELLTLARTADVIVSAVPLTPETTDLYNKEFFAVLKPTAYFINIARGGSVDTDALTAALNEGRLGGAGLDVTDPEPLPAGNPLWKAPRTIITPHMAAWSDLDESVQWIVATENLRRYVAGEKMLNVVDLARGF